MSRLSLIMHRLHMAARQSAPVAQTHEFATGLHVSLRFEDGRTFVYLSRPNVAPSFVEFDTVLRHYSGPKPPSVMVRQAQKQPEADGRFYLVADWDNKRCAQPGTLPQPAIEL
jgi:hypothetical protein